MSMLCILLRRTVAQKSSTDSNTTYLVSQLQSMKHHEGVVGYQYVLYDWHKAPARQDLRPEYAGLRERWNTDRASSEKHCCVFIIHTHDVDKN